MTEGQRDASNQMLYEMGFEGLFERDSKKSVCFVQALCLSFGALRYDFKGKPLCCTMLSDGIKFVAVYDPNDEVPVEKLQEEVKKVLKELTSK